MPKDEPTVAPEFRRQLIEGARAGQSPEALVRKFEPFPGRSPYGCVGFHRR